MRYNMWKDTHTTIRVHTTYFTTVQHYSIKYKLRTKTAHSLNMQHDIRLLKQLSVRTQNT